MITVRNQISFPEVGIIRKGEPKKKIIKDGKEIEIMGTDLGNRLRVVFYPGTGEAQQKFFQIHNTFTPEKILCMLPFAHVDSSWDCYNEGYSRGRLIAKADYERFLYLVDGATGNKVVIDGEPFTPFHPGETIQYTNKAGNNIEIKMKPTGRLKVFLPQMMRMVSFVVKTTSFYDCIAISEQLAAIQAVANAINNGNCAGIPFWLYRAEREVAWSKPDGSCMRVKKWLLNIEIDSDFVKAALQRMTGQALEGHAVTGYLAPLAVSHQDAPDPNQDEGEQEEEEETDVIDVEHKDVYPDIKATMSLETAKEVTTKDGRKLKSIPIQELWLMRAKLHDFIEGVKNDQDREEARFKMAAIDTILAPTIRK